MPKRLDSAYSVTVDMDDERSVFQGHLRIVRSARRARTLRKRGVEVDCYNNPLAPTRFWTWYETEASYDARAAERKRRALLRRAVREAKAQTGLGWVDALLRSLGPSYTEIGFGWPALLDVFSVYYDLSTPEARAQAWAESHVTVRFGGMTPDEYFEAGVRNMSPDCWPLGYNPEVELE